MLEVGDLVAYGPDHQMVIQEYTNAFSIGHVVLGSGETLRLSYNSQCDTKLTVVEGELDIYVAGKACFLHEGQQLRIGKRMPHSWCAEAEEDTRLILQHWPAFIPGKVYLVGSQPIDIVETGNYL